MILRISEKLSRKIRVTPTEKRPLNKNPFADFSCHAVAVEGHEFILAVNTASLYAVVFPGDSIDRNTSFESTLHDRLQAYIVADGFEFLYKRLIHSDGDTVRYCRPLNEIISANLNQLASRVASELAERRRSPEEVTASLNRARLPIIRHQRPRDRFRTLSFQASA
jgi:hypothetical protein